MNSFNTKEYLLYILYYKRFSIYIILCSFLLLFPNNVYADSSLNEPGGILDDALALYKSQIIVWYDGFKTAAIDLLSLLMVANIVWRITSLGFRGNQISDLLFEISRSIVIFGFFLTLIETFSDWTEALFKGFIGLADLAYKDWRTFGSASGIIDNGIQAFQDIIDKVEPFTTDGVAGTVQNAIIWVFSMGMAVTFGLVCLALWAFIGVNLAIQYITFYFLTYAGVIFLAFAGTEWTRNTALNYLNAVLGAAVRYFATVLVAAMSCKVFQAVVESFSSVKSETGGEFIAGIIVPLVTLTLASFFAYAFSMRLPDMLASIVSPATNGVGVSSAGFTHAATQMAGAAKSLTVAGAGLAAAGAALAGSAGGKALDKLHDVASENGHNDFAKGLTSFRASVSSGFSSGINGAKAVGGALKNGYTGMMASMSDRAATDRAFTQLMGNSNLFDGLASKYGESGANDKINELSTLGKSYAADGLSKGMTPGAAADYGFNRAKSDLGLGGAPENTISSGGTGGGSDSGSPAPKSQGSSENFNYGSGSPANPGQSQEAGYQNYRDVMKDPISEDPVTDMNMFDPGDQWKNP